MVRDVVLLGAECEENLALRYIRGELELQGITVTQIDFNSEDQLEQAAAELAASNAPLTGFSMVFTYRAGEFARLANRARELGYTGHITAGGHFAAFNAESMLRDTPAINSVCIGEGERLMVDLAAKLDDLASVRGLVWRDEAGNVHRNERAEKPVDIDSYAWPSRKTPPDDFLGLPIANMLASRGCSSACGFCSIAAWHKLCGGPRYRMRSVENLADEMAGLYERGYRIFNFHDDNFFLRDRDAMFHRVDELDWYLRERGVGRIAFATKCRPDQVDAALFERLKELGMFRVFLGIEAGTEESLKQLGRGQRLADNLRALDIVNALDLHACYNLLLLNPDSTMEDLRGNIDFLREHDRNPLNFCRTEVYAGTPLYKHLNEAGRLQGSYWGHGYTIGDPRAQLFFRLMCEALFQRNHGADNLQHLTMSVDYERQLLAHFFAMPMRLRRDVKAFIQNVNQNTCSYLDELADAAERGFSSDASRHAFTAAIRRRLDDDDRRFHDCGAALLERIRSCAMMPKRHTSDWKKAAAAIGVAASLTFAVACGQDNTHYSETVVRPMPPQDEVKQAIKERISKKVLDDIGKQLRSPIAIDIEVWVDKNGHVRYAGIYSHAPDRKQGALTGEELEKATELARDLGDVDATVRKKASSELKKLGPAVLPIVKELLTRSKDPEVLSRAQEIVDLHAGSLPLDERGKLLKKIRSLSFKDEKIRSRQITVTFTREEVRPFCPKPRRPTHIHEMAPAPRD